MRDEDMVMTIDEAMSHVVSYRSVVQPNESFLLQIKRYGEKLREEREAASESDEQQQGVNVAIEVSAPTAMATVAMPTQMTLPRKTDAEDEHSEEKASIEDSEEKASIEECGKRGVVCLSPLSAKKRKVESPS